ncbi:MAG: ATP-binding protein [Candidatus Omnitrophica bacterium CG11_big_fil_rev_8_21_14_0_20_42_13]|uniref:histidine kinase n=1 Tax=Candidatus Ghiorseimicrobium undicola TaxID=1974746 RepID=A0A2H0LYD1_9BACT|nr:MAG: ATP-binding protein [Candidatus Omnitrophica bacterium CG11_big_fil_rev_8_21_14_0_20_42_13]
MLDLSLHILDIIENAVRARARNINIAILKENSNDRLSISIIDDGEGMDKEMLKKSMDPFFTTKDGKKIGLGLSLFAQAAQQAGGNFKIDSEKGRGTFIKAVFKLSHPDIKPMGDILETVASMITAYPAVRFTYDYRDGENNYYFDSHE